jgi:hypothetical protein
MPFLLLGCKKRYTARTHEALALYHSSIRWFEQVEKRYVPIKARYKQEIAAFSFIEIGLAWEEFIEEAFLNLMVNAKAYTRGCRSLVKVSSKKKAFEMLKGDGNRGFIEWTNVDANIERANRIFLKGKPFNEPLSAGAVHFKRMTVIRNSIAHRSINAQEKLKNLIRELYGSYRQMAPGELLLKTCPPNFSIGSFQSETILETYAKILESAVFQIATI